MRGRANGKMDGRKAMFFRQVFTINTATGVATQLPLTNSGGTGLAFLPVPEPTSAALLAVGTAVLSFLRRRRLCAGR